MTLYHQYFNLVLQKVIQSVKMVPRVIKIGKQRLNVLPYAYDIVLIRKNETEICINRKHCQKFRTTHKTRKKQNI